jgi:pimeloyl-ACP methyl ester carboxylesterase
VCVHGFSRNGRDFDYIAKHLVKIGYRVICPDMPGRGKSEWHPNPSDYNIYKHMNELVELIARLNVKHVDWIGTSMGGIIGMGLASFEKTPIRTLVLNDIGPFIPAPPLARIKQYLGLMPTFKTRETARNFIRQLLSPFGRMTADQLDHMTDYSFIENENHELVLSYDPKIVDCFEVKETDLWYIWETIAVPTLVIRGADSEVLTKDTVNKMLEWEDVRYAEFPDVAHAPALMAEDQIESIIKWLQNQG